MKKLFFVFGLLIGFCSLSHANNLVQAVNVPYTVNVTSASAGANGSVTVTITTPTATSPFSTGYYNYITNIHIEMYATGTLTGGSSPVKCTTTNLGGLQYLFQTAEATGTEQVYDVQYANPLQSTQAAQTVITCPATASVLWNINVAYFVNN